MGNPIKITYSFKFENKPDKIFNILIDRQNLTLIRRGKALPPPWTELNHNKCSNCSLDEISNKYCPVALNLSDIAWEFKDFFAYENANVSVSTEERTYSKNTTIQEGLGSLIGIIMTTSNCPVMEHLKPMVRFHLPFATLEETIYRTVSMYLLAQHFINKDNRAADWKLEGLEKICSGVGQLNRDFRRGFRMLPKKTQISMRL